MLISPPLPLAQKTPYFTAAMQLYINQKIKAPALAAIETLFDSKSGNFEKIKAAKKLLDAFNSLKGLPEPTKENTWHPNAHNLIYLRDWLGERCYLNDLRMGFIRRVINFIIILYAFDPPWRWILDNLKDKALEMEWQARGYQDTWVDSYSKWWIEKKGE